MEGDYRELRIEVAPLEPAREILIARLSQLPFESVLETESGLSAYMPAADWRPEYLHTLQQGHIAGTKLSFTLETIPAQNWNAVWESGFEPIRIDERCSVRAPFHPPAKVRYDIEIMPKMSFGTGHHETTYLMLRMLLDLDVRAKTVLDMGCGTGVLAILACKMGAAQIQAIDIDPWSFENARENAKRNGCAPVEVLLGDVSLLEKQTDFHLILANINKNVLLSDIAIYAKHLKQEGILLLSGFYQEDLGSITEACKQHGLSLENFKEKNQWVSAKYVF